MNVGKKEEKGWMGIERQGREEGKYKRVETRIQEGKMQREG